MKSLTSAFYIVFFILTTFLFDYLFLFHRVGLSLPIFVLFIVLLFEFVKYLFYGGLKLNKFYLLLLPIVWFAATFAFRTDGFVLFWSFVMLLIFIPLYFITTMNPHFFEKFSGVEISEYFLKSSIAPFAALPTILRKLESIARRNQARKSVNARTIFKVSCAVFITVPLFIIVLALLRSADPIFSKNIDKVVDALLPDFNGETITKLFLASVASGYIWFYISGFIETKIFNEKSKGLEFFERIFKDVIIPSIISFSLNFLYIIFSFFQFSYLFGGEKYVKENGLVYSEYAIQGFWETIFVSLINFLVIYFLITRFTLKRKFSKFFLLPSYILMICSSLLMTFSSHTKLKAYENAYGYTVDRLIPHTFMIFILMIFLLLLVALFIKEINRKKVVNIGVFLSITIFLMGFSLFSMGKFIVNQNIKKYYEDESVEGLDLRYLLYDLGLEGQTELFKYKDSNELKKYFKDTNIYNPVSYRSYSTYCNKECFETFYKNKNNEVKKTYSDWQSWNLQFQLFKDQYN